MGIYTNDYPANELSKALRDKQDVMNLTRTELVEMMKTSHMTLRRVEMQDYHFNEKTYQQIADFLNVDIIDVMKMRRKTISDQN